MRKSPIFKKKKNKKTSTMRQEVLNYEIHRPLKGKSTINILAPIQLYYIGIKILYQILYQFCMLKSSKPSWWQFWPLKLPRCFPQLKFQAFDRVRIWRSAFVSWKKEISSGNNWVRLFHAFFSLPLPQGLLFLCSHPLASTPCWWLGQWRCVGMGTWRWHLSCCSWDSWYVLSCTGLRGVTALLWQLQKGHFWSKQIYHELVSKKIHQY